MAWNGSTVYEQRVRFVLEVQQGTFSFADSCRRYNISRTAGYTWWNRFLEEGFEGLYDRSHRPHSCPHATPEVIEKRLVEFRKQFGWGSRKTRKLVLEEFGVAPARRTIDRIFERYDLLTKKRKSPRKPGHPGKPLTPFDGPNGVWTTDFKGHFKMRNGRYCYPLTIQDGFSRYLLGCKGLYTTSIELARPVFINTFRDFGLPAVIRSDNGSPFASIGLARLTRLSAWWIRLGILPETIEPGKPQQNGRHERMHRTLKREATRPPRADLSAQQRHFNTFRHTFNFIRPHEALADETPASVYQPSPRPFPETLPPLEYPAHYEVRKVSTNGGIRWHSRWINISSALGNEFIALEPIGPALWQIYFGPVTLGWLDEDLFVIIDINGNTGRNPIC
jgi:putative transposase